MKTILVAGIGSPFGADQLGWQVIDALQEHSQADAMLSQCQFSKLDRPGAGLIETLQGYERVVLIDAVQAGKPRGTVIRLDAGQVGEQAAGLSSHNFGVAEAVALARAMGQLPEELVLVGLDAGDKPEVAFEASEADKLIEWVVDELSEVVSG
ncbi:hydrogenase maturation protease [Thiohalophilus sp.]|uniref:hydrogenase maturation protease n=1 Tax=Thiohalophilus sp. TaxID=3028392 RepID=UPI002ACDD403|nr:hydrogenase maturation protease [Thiohalophilus sp.]MDZ7661879.1 hydrogenase maturation protease [Thiohalophilus sp.]MDZ7803744.1 hydrogenase maturation protease [Thiohalophilus sp.]